MSDKKLTDFQALVCNTAAGCLIQEIDGEAKVLLVKHGRLGIWLNPGGHIEPNELPHEAAEREFWEETGIKVRAVDASELPVAEHESQYVPSPFLTNLHWISQKNYQQRIDLEKKGQSKTASFDPAYDTKRGCEQHICLLYLVEPLAGIEFNQSVEEVAGIGWFSAAEVEKLDTLANIKTEVARAFTLKAQQ